MGPLVEGLTGVCDGKQGSGLPSEEALPAPAADSTPFPTRTCRFIFAYFGEILIWHHNWERAEATWEKFGG